MLMDVKVELISNPIIRSCTIFFRFIFVSLRSLLILTVILHQFHLYICANSPLRSYACYVMLCSASAFLIHRIHVILRSSLRTWCTIVTPASVQSARGNMTTQARALLDYRLFQQTTHHIWCRGLSFVPTYCNHLCISRSDESVTIRC
jgi:hypothetical protein